MKQGNLIDKFLEHYDAINQKNSRIEYRRIIKKPKKFESILGFGMSFLVLIILIVFFNLTGLYFAILLFDLLFLAYYGLNLFTRNGFGLPATVRIIREEEPEEDSSNEYYDSYGPYESNESYDEESSDDEEEEEEVEEDNEDDDDNDDDDDDDDDDKHDSGFIDYQRVQRY